MAQSLVGDFPIDPQVTSGTQLAVILNRFQAAVETSNSAPTTPQSTYAGQQWLDTSSVPDGILKLRDATNTNWLTLFDPASPPISSEGGTFTGGVIIAPPGASADLWLTAPLDQFARVSLGGHGAVNGVASFDIYHDAVGAHLNMRGNQPLITYTSGAERARLDAAGLTVQNTVAVSHAAPVLALNKAASGQSATLIGYTGGKGRWAFVMGNGSAESGGNAGSDFALQRFADAGTMIDQPFYCLRSSGVVGVAHILRVDSASGGLQFGGVTAATGASVALAWRTDSTIGLRVDATQFGSNWPISITGAASYLKAGASGGSMVFHWSGQGGQPQWMWGGNDGVNMYVYNPANFSVNYANSAGNANTVGGIGAGSFIVGDTCAGAGFASAVFEIPYMRYGSSGSIRYLCWQTNNDRTAQQFRMLNVGYWLLEVAGVQGTYRFAPAGIVSDSRQQVNVLPSAVDATAVIRAMEFISFDGTDDPAQHVALGLSAQDVAVIEPALVAETEQGADSPNASLGSIKHVDSSALLVYVAKAVRELITRVDALEGAL